MRQFVDEAAKAIDIPITWHGKGLREVGKTANGKTIVRIDKKFYRPREVNHLRGDSRKAARKLGWKPETDFKQLAQMMALADLARLQKLQ